jgi:hypothetical protein
MMNQETMNIRKSDLKVKINRNIEYNEDVYKSLADMNLTIQKGECNHTSSDVIDEYNRLKKYYADRNIVRPEDKQYIIESLKSNDKELIDLELELSYLKNIYEEIRDDLQTACGKIMKLLSAKAKATSIQN